MRTIRSFPVLAAVLSAVVAGGALAAEGPQAPGSCPSTNELDNARAWLWTHTDGASNRVERQQRLAVIQAACDQLAPETFWGYVKSWTTNAAYADKLERSGALYYLSTAQDAAIRDIQRTRVAKGVAVWHLYNMGYVFKTPDACFGVDLHLRRAAELAPTLDFLLCSHEHGDHRTPALIQAMVAAGKPVLSRGEPGTTVVTNAGEYRFGSVRVKVDIGDHHREQSTQCNNMLMYQIDCGPAANDCVIYHSGDGNNYEKMKPDRKVDVFIFHVAVGMSVEGAIRHIQPRTALVSHVLELGHSPKPPNAWRWSYPYAFGTISSFAPDEALVLTWGERWLTPGTVLEN